jgi:HK97 family phage portal protein
MEIFGLHINKETDESKFDRLIQKRDVTVGPSTLLGTGISFGGTMAPLSASSSMKLSAVYRCVDVVSDSIGAMDFIVKTRQGKEWSKNMDHFALPMLNSQPNPSMSKFSFMKTLVAQVFLNGNAYIWIHRDSFGNPVSLQLINGLVLLFIKEDLTIYYEIQDVYTHQEGQVDGEDMIHIMNFSYNGLIGVSTLTHAAISLGIASAADAQAKNFFQSGANASGIISVPGKLTGTTASALKASFAAALQYDSVTGLAGGIAVMEGGAEFKPITVNPKDSQMLETRGFNVIDICRFFGVPPVKAFDTGGTKTNVESYQLEYIADTIMPFAEKINNEFNRKLLRPSQRIRARVSLDLKKLMQANLTTQADYYSKMILTGTYSPNDICRELDLETDPDGNDRYYQVNLAKLGSVPVATQNKNTGVDTMPIK